MLVLANANEGRAVVGVSRGSQTHKMVMNVVKGQGYEPILCKKTLIEMGMMKILDSDQKPRVSIVVNAGCKGLLQVFNDVIEGLGKLEGSAPLSKIHP